MNEPAFEVTDVCYAYRSQAALRGLSLQIAPGERIALIGANGSGKSTLLRLLAGLSFPDAGTIRVGGEDLTNRNLEQEEFFYRFRRRVGVVFQNPDIQLFNPSVFDEIAFGPLQMRFPRAEIRDRVERIMLAMGIEELRDRAPHRLSGGEKKRVALASVLVLDPEILLLDEPTAALDPNSERQITELLKSWSGGDKTVITATHDLDALEDVADRCYVLNLGQVAGQGKPLAILHDMQLLTAARLVRPHPHAHRHDPALPHSHVHLSDIT